MDLVEAFKQGKVENTEKVIETIGTHVSNVFICKSKAYKVYLKKKISFGNFEDSKGLPQNNLLYLISHNRS